jgi:hypothetical protein
LNHYYLNDRAEFRHYVNTFFPTPRKWLQNDLHWTTRRTSPRTLYRAPFFRPGDFWKSKEFLVEREKLDACCWRIAGRAAKMPSLR